MHGSDIASLSLLADSATVWTKNGAQGTSWQQAAYSVPVGVNANTVTFRGVRGPSFRGDIALDDITINCRAAVARASPPPAPAAPPPLIELPRLSATMSSTLVLSTTLGADRCIDGDYWTIGWGTAGSK